MNKMHNYYNILGVKENSTANEIKKAYREKALSEHPDKGGNAEKMALLTVAYRTLSNAAERRKFDEEWKFFNTTNEWEISNEPIGSLPTASFPFSEPFRDQHSKLSARFKLKPMEEKQSSQMFLLSDLLSCVETKGSGKNLALENLTPEKAVEYFDMFLRGDLSIANIRSLSEHFHQELEKLKMSNQRVNEELMLYEGIQGVLSAWDEKKKTTTNIVFSLHKITEYAKHNMKKCMDSITSLIQSKQFRLLFSKALYQYWLSDEDILDETYWKPFSSPEALERLVEKFKSKLSENRNANKSNDQTSNSFRCARLLLRLEEAMHIQDTKNERGAFHRRQAFDLLDWVPALAGFAANWIVVNLLIQAGIMLQKAAAQEIDSSQSMADEKVATEIYKFAVSIGHHSTPDIELYSRLHSVKCMMCFKYDDFNTHTTLEIFQKRTLWLCDLFPFYEKPHTNIECFDREKDTLNLMRQFLHNVVEKIDDIPIDNEEQYVTTDYNVRIFYQAYEAVLKNWYENEHNAQLEENLRMRLMQELLINKGWNEDDINFNLNAPWSILGLDGWTSFNEPKPTTKSNLPSYKAVDGLELNFENGEISVILDHCGEDRREEDKLLNILDFNEIFKHGIGAAIFSLDQADLNMPYHPFNKMRFVPSTLYPSQLFHTMFITDYYLKFLTVGREIQRCHPYELRSLDEMISKLPYHLKKIIHDFHASDHEESLNRFWIEAEEVKLAVDENKENGKVLFALGEMKMVVKQHKLRLDEEGNLVDKEGENEGWDCYIFNEEQKKELLGGTRRIEGSALIIIENEWELFFWENHKVTRSLNLDEEEIHLVSLSKCERDDQQKVITEDDSESSRQIYSIVRKACDKTNIPHKYSPEFIFAQEFSKYYNEFADHFPEFARLRELSKVVALVRVITSQRESNKEEIRHLKKYIDDKNKNRDQEYDQYWRETEEKLKDFIRKDIKRQFDEWKNKLSKEKIRENRKKLLTELRNQIGTLVFTESSPEVQEIRNKFHEDIRKDIINQLGHAVWVIVSQEINEKVIEPKIPTFIEEMQSHKRAACKKQILDLFKDELAGVHSFRTKQLVDRFLDGYDEPLIEELVIHDRNQVAKKIREIFPEHTVESLDQALNCSLANIEELVVTQTKKALVEHQKQLRKQLVGREKLDKSFDDLELGTDTQENDIGESCLWVPACFRHEVDTHCSRAVYGGVSIVGRIKSHANPKDTEALLRQTHERGRTMQLNRAWGNAFGNYYKEKIVRPAHDVSQYTIKNNHYVNTPFGRRYLDVAVVCRTTGEIKKAYETKTGNSEYTKLQQRKDEWIKINKKLEQPVKLVRLGYRPRTWSK